jgi:hypothetical protein
MRQVVFVEFLAQLKELTPDQKKRLVRHLMGRALAPVPRTMVPLVAPRYARIAARRTIGRGHVGPKPRTQALPLSGFRPNLQCIPFHTTQIA